MDDKRKINRINRIIQNIYLITVTFIILMIYKSLNEIEYNVSKENVFIAFTENDNSPMDSDEHNNDIVQSDINNDDNTNADLNTDSFEEDFNSDDIAEGLKGTEIEGSNNINDGDTQNEPVDSPLDNKESSVTEPAEEVASTSSDNPQTEPEPTTNSISVSEGQNPTEGAALMTYINQYRTEAGISPLIWNSNLEYEAQHRAAYFATGEGIPRFGYFYTIGRQCNGAKNAQRAISDWISGNDYVPSEEYYLLNENYTEMGGALYYLPSGNEYGYHYFWVVCLM